MIIPLPVFLLIQSIFILQNLHVKQGKNTTLLPLYGFGEVNSQCPHPGRWFCWVLAIGGMSSLFHSRPCRASNIPLFSKTRPKTNWEPSALLGEGDIRADRGSCPDGANHRGVTASKLSSWVTEEPSQKG